MISSLLDKRIQYLNLFNNNLTNKIMKNYKFQRKKSILKRLHLGYNEITNKGLFYIQEGIKKHPKIEIYYNYNVR